MKFGTLLVTGVFAGASAVAATPDFSQVGFATLGGGTTGGAGGEIVEVSTFAEFKQYAEDLETPYVIIVNGEINTGIKTYIDSDGAVASSGTETTYGEIVLVGNNKTIVGKGSNGFLNRVGVALGLLDDVGQQLAHEQGDGVFQGIAVDGRQRVAATHLAQHCQVTARTRGSLQLDQ